MTKILEVASEWSLPVIILDRPNPLRGDRVDGPVIRAKFQSFEGYHIVPIRHGLTIGELAIMANEMGWIKDLKRANLTIIPMVNWKRSYWLDQSEHPWINPHPSIKSIRTNLSFSGFGLLEGTNLNDGKGTDRPYLRAGAPWLSGYHLADKLSQLKLPGIKILPVEYIPRMKQTDQSPPIYVDELCSGVDIQIIDPNFMTKSAWFLDDIINVEVTTHESAIRIISKVGELNNPADRDHCLQYMVAIGLLKGNLVAEDYEDDVAKDPRIDALREKMVINEDKRYSKEYLEADKRSIANRIQIHFNDGTSTKEVEVEYPIGHKRRREEGIPVLEKKFMDNLTITYDEEVSSKIFNLCMNQKELEETSVIDFQSLFSKIP